MYHAFMEFKNARELGPSDLYERRKHAVVLHRKGMSRTEIAPLVGAHRNTVGQWLRQWQVGGMRPWGLSVRSSQELAGLVNKCGLPKPQRQQC
jgi:transposase-like protein